MRSLIECALIVGALVVVYVASTRALPQCLTWGLIATMAALAIVFIVQGLITFLDRKK